MFFNHYLKRVVVILFSLLTIPILGLAEDEPRVEYEAGYYYTIKKGDTLWDLSDRFLDSPYKWPDLWQENKQIPNPHWIYPGERIRLYRRAGAKGLDNEAGAAGKPEPTAEEKKSYFHYSSMDHLGFVKKKAVEPSGVLFKVNGDNVLIGDNDIVYVKKMGTQSFIPGDRYTVYRTHPIGKDTRTIDYQGVQHYLSGIIEIIQDEPAYAVATVVDAYRSIQIDDMIMPYKQRSSDVALQESNKAVNGQIICSEERMLIFGDQTIAFIDRGTRDGIIPGQTYSIYYKDMARLNLRDRKDTPLIPLEFASLLVLLAEDSSATVIITRAEKDISPGARFHWAKPHNLHGF